MNHNVKTKTNIYKNKFKWGDGVLLQLVEVIRHYPTEDRDVGIHSEWHEVKVDGENVKKLKIK